MSIPGLTITATPIGNLDDLSPRAVASFQSADWIACEDTRHTGLMLKRLGISHGQLIAYHDHTSTKAREKLLKALADGKAITLVSDAGTPLISDPGYRLVRACRDSNIPVTTVPGPSAVLAALVISGLPTDRFHFAGFLPNTASKRQKALAKLMRIDATIICYESAKRLAETLAEAASIAPHRHCAVARELTKTYEESWLDEVHVLATYFAEHDTPKGEIVVMFAPPSDDEHSYSDDDLIAMLKAALDDGLSRRDAVRDVTEATKMGKTHIYDLMLRVDHSSS
ncbi:MAG: 16S rRNA (cytidine(1402)-2'-O)-methyltransferase [Alphaproteobacteria bacterium]|nr:16S rRNA (cytidine(1402)-2'-O)-methyltransferase [Alphaproteobacteria bacterium]